MTEPSEAALKKACEMLEWGVPWAMKDPAIIRLAHHFDAEDRLAQEALRSYFMGAATDFVRRHILPDPKPTVEQVLKAVWDKGPTMQAQALRDAGLLREDTP